MNTGASCSLSLRTIPRRLRCGTLAIGFFAGIACWPDRLWGHTNGSRDQSFAFRPGLGQCMFELTA